MCMIIVLVGMLHFGHGLVVVLVGVLVVVRCCEESPPVGAGVA